MLKSGVILLQNRALCVFNVAFKNTHESIMCNQVVIFIKNFVHKLKVKGYEELKTAVSKIAANREINVCFKGTKDENGASWCPDCVVAEPFIMSALETYGKVGSVFIIVDVGERAFWKDMKNPFRTDKDIAIQVLPSLIRWKGPQRLEGSQCLKNELLEMFFTDDN